MPILEPIADLTKIAYGDNLTDTTWNAMAGDLRRLNLVGRIACNITASSIGNKITPACGDAGPQFYEKILQTNTQYFELKPNDKKWQLIAMIKLKGAGGGGANQNIAFGIDNLVPAIRSYVITGAAGPTQYNLNATNAIRYICCEGSLPSGLVIPTTGTSLVAFTVSSGKVFATNGIVNVAANYWDGCYFAQLRIFGEC